MIARMLRTRFQALLLSGAWLCLTPASASAQTFVVDDTPGTGADFSSIVAALASVPAGAVLDVQPGSYAGFTVGQDVKIIGTRASEVEITSEVMVSQVLSHEPVVLSRMRLTRGLIARDVATSLILDNLDCSVGTFEVARPLVVENAQDVRMAKVTRSTLKLTDSRLQASECSFFGTASASDGLPSEPAAEIFGTSLVHMDHCTLLGASGQSCPTTGFCTPQQSSAGSGGPGAVVGPHAVLRAVRSTIQGGWPGLDDACGCLFYWATPGEALIIQGRAELWENEFLSASNTTSYALEPGGSVTASTPYPSLTGSNASPLQPPITLAYTAEPQSSRRLIVGRATELTAIPGLTIGRLVTVNRVASLGASIAAEESVTFPQPPWALGTLLHAQVSRTRAGGDTELSNSVTIVAR